MTERPKSLLNDPAFLIGLVAWQHRLSEADGPDGEPKEPNTGDPFMDGAIRMSRGSSLETELQRLKDDGVIR